VTASHLKTHIITIDGPAGAGKSTVAKLLAQKLNYFYLDTGAMYRSLTLKALREKVNWEDEDQLIALAKNTKIELKDSEEGMTVYMDSEDVTEIIRSLEVTNNTFYIARTAGVREVMVGWQREIAFQKNVVAEGRDIGTVVFPNAENKFYLDADVKERAQRRFDELKEKGKDISLEQIEKEVKERDDKDINRSAGPLKKADDAFSINSTNLQAQDVVRKMIEKMGQNG